MKYHVCTGAHEHHPPAPRGNTAFDSAWAPGAWASPPAAGAPRWRRSACAVEIGYRVIDTAEMYGEGRRRTIARRGARRRAARGRRAARRALHRQQGLPAQRQPRRHGRGLRAQPDSGWGSSQIDLYLLHWRGTHRAERDRRGLRGAAGAAGASGTGASAISIVDGDAVARGHAGGDRCAANQVYYSLTERGRRVRPAALAARARDAADGLQPDRPGRAVARPRPGARSANGSAPARRSSRWRG